MLMTVALPLAICKAGPLATLSETNSANLYITCDNSYRVWLNGELVGEGNKVDRVDKYKIAIKHGDILTIMAMDNEGGNKTAGLFCCIIIPESCQVLGTSHKWRCAKKEPKDGWKTSTSMTEFGSSMSEKNVNWTHQSRIAQYRETYDPLIHGRYVWSDKPAGIIWIKNIIDLQEFEYIADKAEKKAIK